MHELFAAAVVVVGAFDYPPALAFHPAGADVKELDGGFEFVGVDGDDVGVGAVG